MRLLIACSAAFAMWLSAIAGANETLDAINDVCSRKWGMDFEMIEHCRDRQVAAATEVFHLHGGEAAVHPYRTYLATCFHKWTRQTGTDWAMVLACYEPQADAVERLMSD